MVGVTAVKLGLFLLCRIHENEIVQAYAKDHFFDVVTNLLGGMTLWLLVVALGKVKVEATAIL
ncbi:hypothetical protein KFL_003430010, partial [Klebsormidium nitens]